MLHIVNDNAVSRLTFTGIQAEDLRFAIQQIVSDQHLFNHCDTKPLDHGWQPFTGNPFINEPPRSKLQGIWGM